jgi:crotonobetainyl-CoA:carnitine CoA-transferase CaiB-like acyl-CoA transferase
MVVSVQFPNGGPVLKVPGRPIKMSGVVDETEFLAPLLGADTLEVLQKYESLEALHQIYDPVMSQSKNNVELKYKK